MSAQLWIYIIPHVICLANHSGVSTNINHSTQVYSLTNNAPLTPPIVQPECLVNFSAITAANPPNHPLLLRHNQFQPPPNRNSKLPQHENYLQPLHQSAILPRLRRRRFFHFLGAAFSVDRARR